MSQLLKSALCALLMLWAVPLWAQLSVGGFVENRGQWNRSVLYRLQTLGTTTWITANGWVTDLQTTPTENGGDSRREGVVIRTTFLGANTQPATTTAGERPTRCNFFRGSSPGQWFPAVPVWEEAYVANIYPGIDARYYLQNGDLRYDLLVAPNADPQKVQFTISGATGITITPRGTLLIETPVGTIEQKGLVAYQGEGHQRKEIECRFAHTAPGVLGFDLGSYDRSKPLVIDPLVFSTLVGGSQDDLMLAVCRDSSGNIYAGGYSLSTDFPTNDGAYSIAYSAGRDVVIAKYSPDAGVMLYATYLGGEGDEMPLGLASDATGTLLVAGWTRSRQFPTTPAALRSQIDSANTASFLTRISPTGDALLFSTYVTASYGDFAFSLATDRKGYAYLTGRTLNQSFPTSPGAFDSVLHANYDSYVVRINPSGDSIVAATLIGGDNVDEANAIALDTSGNVYITGITRSSDFPVTPNAYRDSRAGNIEVFVSKFNPTLTQLLYSTVFGGSADDFANGIAVTPGGQALVAGRTLSANFPTTAGSLLPTTSDNENGFITRLSAAGSMLEFSTFLGGSGMDRITGMGMDDRNNPYVVGQTASADFPTTPNADFPTITGGDDAFVAKLHSTGNRLLYSSFFGSDLRDEAIAVAVDQPGNAYVAGFTSAPNFPTTPGAANRTYSGNRDGFLLKLPLVNPPIGSVNASGAGDAPPLVSQISVAPLANQLLFTIRLRLPATITAELVDGRGGIVGQRIAGAEYPSGTHQIAMPIGGLPSGSYLLRVRGRDASSNQESIQRVVVVR
ncbi:MAG: SBBP repeat-containing protein [Chlorobi bacterium]|nr:SBBP repeat-containing protein [Chlorobiota bacterium]